MTVFELTTSEKLVNQKFLGVPIDWYSYLSVMSFFINRTVYTILAYTSAKNGNINFVGSL